VQPPASLKALADPIYEAFYGLREQPFSISTDPRFLFLSAPHRRAYEELRAGLLRGESLMLLTGETGSGKTTLVRGVVGALGGNTFASFIHQPYMNGREMLRLVLRDFGLVSREELRRGVLADADAPQLLDALEGFLRSLVPIDSRAVVVLDEAQSLSPTLLDEIRMLTAFERDGKRLIQVILCGQPMLLNTLKTEPMYALNERITRRVALTPLSHEEVDAYIKHRLEVAGGADAVTFRVDATKLIAELSRGLPRRINVLCDRTLQEGRVDGAMSIGPDLVKRAAKSLAGAQPAETAAARTSPETDEDAVVAPTRAITIKLPPGSVVGRSWHKAALGAGLVAVLGAGVYLYYASTVVSDAEGTTTPPAKPVLAVREPAPAPPPPTEAELKEIETRAAQMLFAIREGTPN
jgi:general secretion pathway protein A